MKTLEINELLRKIQGLNLQKLLISQFINALQNQT